MKRIIYSVCTLTLALALTAWGEEVKNTASVKSKGKAGSTATVQSNARSNATVRSSGLSRGSAQFRTQRSVSTPQFSQRSYHATPHVTANATVHQNNARVQTFRERNFSTNTANNQFRAQNNVAINRERNMTFNRNRNVTVNGQSNFAVNRERSFNVNRGRNFAINNSWRGSQFNGQNYAAFRNYHREWHDRGWWTNHHPRISFYFGAPYYWDAGYWYPAWGYYPDYVYQYDGPIYGYNGLAPDQVIVDVQRQLQRDGYYPGPVDGVLGPVTRQAIAAFQADHGLAITSTVDEPTLATLGLT